jgi:N-acetylglutamate synthase-like GNAT family acetyltransferase
MPIMIRPARQAEQKLIRQIVRDAQINPFQLDWRRFLVAEVDGRVVGTGQIKPHRDGSRELASIAVVPGFRRHGIASAIIRQLIAHEDGQLVLTCNASLEGFYRQFGFRRLGKEELLPYFRRFYRFMRVWNGIVMQMEAGN